MSLKQIKGLKRGEGWSVVSKNAIKFAYMCYGKELFTRQRHGQIFVGGAKNFRCKGHRCDLS